MSDQSQDLNAVNNLDIAGLRIRYKNRDETFTEDQLASKDPLEQFSAWFTEACTTQYITEPNAAFLATATKDGFPSVRAVLLKNYNKDGFKFYTNYHSRKGREIEENPNVAMTLYWEPLHRAIRIEGVAEKTSAEDSDQYFHSRPFSSQVGAIASRQSSVIANRQTLIIKEKELLAENTKETIKRPDYWGGYLIRPKSIEFWQGQSDRLHDRIVFRKPKPKEKIDNIFVHEGENGWVYERLSP